MMWVKILKESLIMILLGAALVSCSNAIPTVVSLGTSKTPQIIPAQDPRNFAQINAGSAKENLGTYRGNIRISQSLGDMQSTSNGGYKLKGTVTLQR